MKHTAKEREEASEEAKEMQGPEYPWGLKITLGEDELEKLGLGENPKSGTRFKIEAEGYVCAERQGSSDDYVDDRSVTIQLTSVAVEPDGDEEEPLYRRKRS
jgi:hypothetical protein